jgi:hypothetical protein
LQFVEEIQAETIGFNTPMIIQLLIENAINAISRGKEVTKIRLKYGAILAVRSVIQEVGTG